MTQQAEQAQSIHRDELMAVDYSRFVRDVGAELRASNLTWAERVRVRRDIEFLIVESRGSRRPEVLGMLVGCICEVLPRGSFTGFRRTPAPRSPHIGDR